MEDKFKEYIDSNRQSFESHQEDYDALWERIDDGLNKSKRITRHLWKYAAAVTILALSTIIYLQKSSEIPVALAEAETYYAPLIAKKMTVIKTYHAEVDNAIVADLDELNQVYKELKLDLKDQADSEEVVSAIIQNYRIKLQILDQILNEIEAKKDEENKTDVTI